MRIVGAIWKPDGQAVLLECACGRVLEHAANRKRVICDCGRSGHLEVLREQLMLEYGVHDPIAA